MLNEREQQEPARLVARPPDETTLGRLETSNLAVKAARTHSLFREVNERLREVNQTFAVLSQEADFVCECANEACLERLTLTLTEYDRVRRVPTRFLVAAERPHLFPEVERVVEEHADYWVVEKISDAAAAAARARPALEGQRVGPPTAS